MTNLLNKEAYIRSLFQIVRNRPPNDKEYQEVLSRFDNSGVTLRDIETVQGVAGEDGDSAYQIALNNSFIGTEQQWLESLVGEQGEKGDKGDDGIASSIFGIWAEENAPLGSNTTEWAFGNGANTPHDQGIPLPVDCILFAGALSLNTGTSTVGVYRNGNKVFDIVSNPLSPKGTTVDAPTEIPFSKGDVVGFKTTVASGTGSPNTVTAWFKTI